MKTTDNTRYIALCIKFHIVAKWLNSGEQTVSYALYQLCYLLSLKRDQTEKAGRNAGSKIILCSWFHASQVYINERPTRYNNIQSIFYCKISLHVSGAVHTHHQEYVKL